jgi:hypothetical protein
MKVLGEVFVDLLPASLCIEALHAYFDLMSWLVCCLMDNIDAEEFSMHYQIT